MHVLLLAQFVRDMPWMPSWWAVTLARGLCRAGVGVRVAVDGTECPHAFEGVELLVRDPFRRFMSGRPHDFARWAAGLGRPDEVRLSLTRLVAGDLWMPLDPPALALASDLWRRHAP